MAPPTLLKLAFVKGPREGESLEYKPGSTIRIGRVVRGNEIAIKDTGISTKHLRIVSDSENWMIHDLGSSNGTLLNSESLDADTPVALSQGDEIKLGEYTSIVVSFETDVQAEEEEEEEHKLPPRPRRNNRRLPDQELVPVQEKPTRKGRSAKQEEPEAPKRTTRTTRSKVAITKEEEEGEAVAVEKKGNARARGDKKNTEAVVDSVELEIEDSPKGVEVSSAVKRVTRSSRKIGNVKSEDDTGLEEMRRTTRSKRKEIGGDSFLDLDMVLSQARAKKKKMEKKSVVEEMEARDEDVVEEDKENEKDVEAQKGRSKTSDKEDDASKRVEKVEIESRKTTLGEDDETCKRVEQMEIESRKSTVGEDDETCKRVEQTEIESRKSILGEDGEAENLQDGVEEEGDCKSDEDVEEHKESEKDVEAQKGRSETSGREEEAPKRVEQVEIEAGKSTLGGEEDVEEDYKENEMKDVSDTSDKDDETSKRAETESGKSSLGEDGEEENLQDAIETSDGECVEEEKEKAEEEKKVDLEKMTLGEWFKYMEVYMRKKIVDETEEMIEGMRAKSRRVHQYIAEQKQAQGKEQDV